MLCTTTVGTSTMDSGKVKSSSTRHHPDLGEVERELQLGDSALCGHGLVGDLEVGHLLFGGVVDFAAQLHEVL